MDQLDLERYARDRALTLHETHRSDLVGLGRAAAMSIARERGRVTSIDVRERLIADGVDLGDHDRRWFGAIFAPRGMWRRVGWLAIGSHCRPVAVWELREGGVTWASR